MTGFDEKPYFDEYEKIRNVLKKFTSSSVVAKCIRYLHSPVANRMKQIEKHPWQVLLLIKWSLIESEQDESLRQPATSIDVRNMRRQVYALSKVARFPSDFEHFSFFMRSIAFQQFMYQHELNHIHLIRQFYLFADLPLEHFLKNKFLELTGVQLHRFLELSLCMSAQFFDLNSHKISANFFDTLRQKYSSVEVSNFLRSFTKSLAEAKLLIDSLGTGARSPEEFYEQTPFLAFPLIREGHQFLCVERHVLFRCMEHYVYDRMKVWNAQKFMNEFGLIFERHVGKLIEVSDAEFIDEEKIKILSGEKNKLIDFVISETDANVFVEVKATELAYQAKYAHMATAAEERTGFILTAIEQGQDVSSRLSGLRLDAPFNSKDKNYLIVVTYKQLNLSNGKSYYEGIAKKALEAICKKYDGKSTIPVGNIYFLSIEEFEVLAEAVRQKLVTFSSALERARVADSAVETQKFDFSLHLIEWGFSGLRPKFMLDRLLEEFDDIEGVLEDAGPLKQGLDSWN